MTFLFHQAPNGSKTRLPKANGRVAAEQKSVSCLYLGQFHPSGVLRATGDSEGCEGVINCGAGSRSPWYFGARAPRYLGLEGKRLLPVAVPP